MTRPLRVLMVRVGAMGDVLHGLPAVAALREAMPECFIGWAVEPKWLVLLGKPIVDRVHEVPARDWNKRPVSGETLREILALRAEMRAEKYDVCVDLQGSIRSGVIAWLSGARVVGAAVPRERPAAWFYGEKVQVLTRNVIEGACELVGAGVGMKLAPTRVTIPVTAAWEGGEGFVFVAPGAGWGAKEWGVERFQELVKRLVERGVLVVVNGQGTTHSAERARRVAGVGGRVADVGLGELVELTRRAAVVIGGDTGPVHLGAALGRPTVAIFGPTDPERNGPAFVGARVTVIRNAASRNDYRRHAETEAGLARVTVDEVLQAVLAIMEGGTGSKPVPGE